MQTKPFTRQTATNCIDVFKCDSQGNLKKVKLNSDIKLSEPRSDLAATTVENIAIFAGGFDEFKHDSNYIDAFKCDDQGNLEKVILSSDIKLSASGKYVATTVGDIAIFASCYSLHIDAFKCDSQGNLEKVKLSPDIKLSASGKYVATTVGNLAIFAGFEGRYNNRVDVFKCNTQGNLEKVKLRPDIKLSVAHSDLAASTVGNLAIFAGGSSDIIDAFKCDTQGNLEKLKLRPDIKLSVTRGNLAATAIKNIPIFAGGKNSHDEYQDAVDIFDFYDLYLTFDDLPENPALPTNTTVTPINNQSYGFILQHRSEAISALCKDKKLTDGTRLTTSTIRNFSHTLFALGLDGLLSLESHQITEESDFPPELYGDGDQKNKFSAAYGAYFWEIFFHIPFLIASTLNAHQRYNEARQWYQYIFNPTIPGKDKDRFWRFLPFRGHTPEKLEQTLSNKAAIKAYKENPFDPYAIARLRIGAYEKAVVMKYIDNLLNWGDALFTQDNWESITQATTLYLLAYDLLGEKPKNLGKPPAPEPKTFADIKAKGDIADFRIALEEESQEYKKFIKQLGDDVPFNDLDAYFCVSENQEFAKYWDRVEDRLFKIRHCQNIKGIKRQLALFSPPIDPKQLVRQAAAGDGSMALPTADQIPNYRFSYLLERAKGMVSTVI